MQEVTQVNYEELADLIRRMDSEAAELTQLLDRLKREVDGVYGKEWSGEAADAFYAEMQNFALPALARTVNAWQASSETAAKIVGIYRDAEEEAAAGFRGEDDGTGRRDGATSSSDPKFNKIKGGKDAKYEKIDGIAFIRGGDAAKVHPNDVSQGQLGDCYLLSSMAALANEKPGFIEKMIRANSDGTYTVTFYKKRDWWAFWDPEYKKVEITVDGDFPAKNGQPVFAQPGDVSGKQKELWPMIIEKAYAKWQGGYNNISGGYAERALSALTGKPSEVVYMKDLDFKELASYAKGTNPIVVDSLSASNLPMYKNGDIVTGHSYYVTGVDEANKMVSIRNPWGWNEGEIRISFDEFKKNFNDISVVKM